MGFTEVNWINPCQCVVRYHIPTPQTKGSKLVGTISYKLNWIELLPLRFGLWVRIPL